MKLGASGKHDELNLASDAKFQKMLKKLGEDNEFIVFSCQVKKINRKGKEQDRGFCITTKALYNLKMKSWKCQRRIELVKVGSLSKSSKNLEEFAVHVPEEYDYYFKSTKRDTILKQMQDQIHECLGADARIIVGKTDDVKRAVVTRPEMKMMSREQRWRRYQELINQEEDDSENEDEKEKDSYKPYGPSGEEVTPDNFEYLQVLGRGSFGKVLKVREKATGDILAMKILKKKDIIERKQVEHTKAERDILASMQFPFLMGMKYAFQNETKLYFVLHYYSGGELFYHLQKEKKFKLEACRLMVAETALALGHLHSFGYIYRDLKPENLLLDAEGHICVTDFGLAKNIGGGNKYAQTFCGTPEYLAPEIVNNQKHNKAVDWWSVGILLYELSVGIPPFYSVNANEMYQKIQTGPLIFPRKVTYQDHSQAELPSSLKDCIAKLLDRDPIQRLGGGEPSASTEKNPTDIDQIMAQPFFAILDREAVMQKKIKPAYHPGKGNNVDPDFLKVEARDTIAEPNKDADHKHDFDAFDFDGATKNVAGQTSG